ncbi:MAG: HAD family hydrolase [Cyclobacteriaceae bacterium]
MKKVFNQNVIALVWDFDKTLIPYYMQKPLFQKYGVDEPTFWNETNQLVGLYAKKGIRINHETSYLNHLLTYVHEGHFKGLNNDILFELGKELTFFKGIPDFFKNSKDLIHSNDSYAKYEIQLEHYVVSSGLTQMVKGSPIAEHIDGVWACEFIESPLIPNNGKLKEKESVKEISSIAYSIDNTTKTRALFEISKGVNKYPDEIDVNQAMAEDDRRIPFKNMIYIADGPSDIPSFSVVKKGGGKALAVYDPDNEKSFPQAKSLLTSGRVDMFGEANYSKGTTYTWLMEEIKGLADQIVLKKQSELSEAKSGVPKFI